MRRSRFEPDTIRPRVWSIKPTLSTKCNRICIYNLICKIINSDSLMGTMKLDYFRCSPSTNIFVIIRKTIYEGTQGVLGFEFLYTMRQTSPNGNITVLENRITL
jgi:hypothetical protein